MTRTRTTRRRTVRKTELSPRAVLLSCLGAVSLGRKQALKSLDDLAAATTELRERADAAARGAGNRVARARKQAQARLAPMKKQATAFAAKAQSAFETRFAPLLVTLGAKPARAKRVTRKPRPAAKRARKRA